MTPQHRQNICNIDKIYATLLAQGKYLVPEFPSLSSFFLQPVNFNSSCTSISHTPLHIFPLALASFLFES